MNENRKDVLLEEQTKPVKVVQVVIIEEAESDVFAALYQKYKRLSRHERSLIVETIALVVAMKMKGTE